MKKFRERVALLIAPWLKPSPLVYSPMQHTTTSSGGTYTVTFR
jgi:hypothetical protein